MRLKNQIALIAAALTATTSLVCGQGQQSAESLNQPIVGTWQVLRHGADCATGKRLNPDFPTLMTFNRGGTLIGYAVAPGESPGLGSPEFGNWVKQGPRTYTVRDVSYSYDENGAFTGRAEITFRITLDADADSFTSNQTIDVFDANGNLLFSFCGKAKGTRFN
jgi:hypothetical protein